MVDGLSGPTLDGLIASAAAQNLSLREAGSGCWKPGHSSELPRGNCSLNLRPLSEASSAWPASEVANTAPGYGSQFFDQWGGGFNLSWELDFWGRFRRAVTAAEHSLEASCANYDQVMSRSWATWRPITCRYAPSSSALNTCAPTSNSRTNPEHCGSTL